jgi:hypothetical protein
MLTLPLNNLLETRDRQYEKQETGDGGGRDDRPSDAASEKLPAAGGAVEFAYGGMN